MPTLDVQVASPTDARGAVGLPDTVSRSFGVPGVAAVPQPREALLGPAAQRLDVGLLAARTAAALRRVMERSEIDEADEAVLIAVIQVLEDAADAVESIEGGGRLRPARTSYGFGAMAFTVELAAPTAPEDLPEFLRNLVNNLRLVHSERNPEIAERLLPIFSLLADTATQQSGTVGEGPGILR